MLDLLIGLTGLLGGFALAKIAPEELKPGEKYLVLFQKLLFSILTIASSVLLIKESRFVVFGIFLIVAMTAFIYSTITKSKAALMATDLIFLFPYFTLPSYQTLLASFIFLYGLPVGTLLRTEAPKNILKG